METIEERLNKIEERNNRVEQDKAWEGSSVRIFFVSLITYLAAFFALLNIGASKPHLNAFIPVLCFILSTQSVPVIKRFWIKHK